MNWVDIVIVIIVLGAGTLGSRVGLIRAVFFFGAFILATVISARAAAALSSHLEELVHSPNLAYFVSFIGLFGMILAGLIAVGGIVCKVADVPPLKWLDRLVGSILGLLAGILLVGLLVIYLTQSPVSNSKEWLEGSFLVPIVKAIIAPIFQEFLEKKSVARPVVSIM